MTIAIKNLVVLILFAGAGLATEHGETTLVLSIQESIQAGDLDGASLTIAQALARTPNDGGLLNLRGILHARRGEMLEARTDFEKAVRFSPSLTPAWQNLGRACLQIDEVLCSVQAWQRVLRAKPGDTEAREGLALLYEKQGKFAESLRELEAANQDNLLLRCMDLTSLGRVAEAKVVAAQLAKQAEFAEGDLGTMRGALDLLRSAGIVAALVEGLDARGAAGVPSLRRLVIAYEQLNRPTDALQTLERVAQLEPNDTADLLELARLAEGSKNYAGALGYLAHARDLQPGNARIHFLFGLIAGELNLPVEAKQSLDKALAIEPNNPNYKYAMGTVILKTRDAATAAAYFQDFVRANPTDARGHYALGLAYFGSGDYAKAEEEMEIIEHDAGLSGAAEYYLGRIARISGRIEEATQRLQKSSQLIPKFSETHTELARIALLQGHANQARAELDTALHLTPESFPANQELLLLYRRTHDPRADQQGEVLKKLDEDRSKRAELMLRMIEVKP